MLKLLDMPVDIKVLVLMVCLAVGQLQVINNAAF